MIQIKGIKGKRFTRVEVPFIVRIDGNLEVDLKEVGPGLDGATLSKVSQRLNKLFTGYFKLIPCWSLFS